MKSIDGSEQFHINHIDPIEQRQEGHLVIFF